MPQGGNSDIKVISETLDQNQIQSFVDNLKAQHPDKLSYSQLTGDNSGMLTPRDINYISTFKLTKI